MLVRNIFDDTDNFLRSGKCSGLCVNGQTTRVNTLRYTLQHTETEKNNGLFNVDNG